MAEHVSGELDSIRMSEERFEVPHPDDLMPHKAQAIAGEILHDLRSALDNLIYEASRRNNNGVEVEQTQFVIVEDDESYRKQQWRLAHLTEEQRNQVESIQPYNCEDKWAYLLSALSNRDKHRYLITLYNHADITVSARDHETLLEIESPRWTLAGKYPPVDTLNTLLYRVCEVVRAFFPESETFFPALTDPQNLVAIDEAIASRSSRLVASQERVSRLITVSNDRTPAE
ncbi:MAG: hypothetical protein F4056_09730 [Chloroflexi bacterium]|nr:hypothetical protein [Chloroflexota bacterium]